MTLDRLTLVIPAKPDAERDSIADVWLEAGGEDFEPVLVKIHKGEHREDAFLALNPRAQVPVLVDGPDTITQILAIVLHLDARFPGQGFLPAAGMARTRALELLAWMNNTVHPTFTHVFMPLKFAASHSPSPAPPNYGAFK